MTNIILGGYGQLGSYIYEKLNKKAIRLSSSDCNITNPKNIEKVFKKYKPNFVFNCSAYHNTNECEINAQLSFDINSVSLKYLSDFCNLYNSKLIHFSSDYVFNGKSKNKYTEKSHPDPINIYGISKYAGEQIVKYYCKKFLICRISSVYSTKECKAKKDGNFVDKIITNSKNNFIKVTTQKITPSFCEDIADQLIYIYKKVNNKLIHISPPDSTTWYQFAKYINKELKLGTRIKKNMMNNENINRPVNSALKSSILINEGFYTMSDWKTGFKKYKKTLKKTKIE